VFSVSATARNQVKHYIANQREHHRRIGFRDEFIAMLERAEVDYDLKFVYRRWRCAYLRLMAVTASR